MTSRGAAPAMPAGCTLGHASTHLPHVLQASSIAVTRSDKTASKDMPVIAATP